MTEEITGVTPEVAAPEIETEIVSEEMSEPAEPTTIGDGSVDEPEPAEPVKQTPEMDSWYATKRRELQAEREQYETEMKAKLEAESAKAAELEALKAQYERKEKEDMLRLQAEQYGVPYEDLLAEVQAQEEAEKVKQDLESERATNATLAEQIEKMRQEALLDKMHREDEITLQQIDPKIQVNELGQDFFQLRLAGLTPIQAYKATLAIKETTTQAPTPGKVNSAPAPKDYITEAEYDSMSPSEKQKNWELAYKSMSKW